MSQSRAPASGKASGKAKAKAAPAKRKEAVTVRIIPAPVPAAASTIKLSAKEQECSKRALQLAADIKQAIESGGDQAAVLAPEAVQSLLAALCKVYSSHVELGERYDAFSPTNPVTPTDVMVTASGLLKAANPAVFELGMWQSWTGR